MRPISLLKKFLLAIFVVIAIFLFVYTHHPPSEPPSLDAYTSTSRNVVPGSADLTSKKLGVSRDPYFNDHARFWEKFALNLLKHGPSIPPPQLIGKARVHRFDALPPRLTRENLIIMSETDVKRVRLMHQAFLKALNQTRNAPFYIPGTRGIVSTAGGKYLPVITVSLRMLRRSGSKLPMEVFLSTYDEYEPYICNNVFRKLNARCVIMEPILKSSVSIQSIKNYQLKIFAMLFSSFEDMLFLDADVLPMKDPDTILRSELYQTSKMILWPDYWQSTASPLFFQVSGQNIPALDAVATTESGEIAVSKRTHAKSLMLAAYYNYFGPQYFYPLLSQGAPGQGDKETFLAAATAVGEPYYQVLRPVVAVGHNVGNSFQGSAMVQFDPMQDAVAKFNRYTRDQMIKTVEPIFAHANFPKFNPATIFDEHDSRPLQDQAGKYVKPWDPRLDDNLNLDRYQQGLWKEMVHVGCELENVFQSWRGRDDICSKIRQYYQVIFESPQTQKSGPR